VGGDVPVDNDVLLVANFVNLKIKSSQSFGGAHKGRIHVCVFIGVSVHTCMSICVYTVCLKKKKKKKKKKKRHFDNTVEKNIDLKWYTEKLLFEMVNNILKLYLERE
jgi:hypothetical protein